jgi:hypothetical protein
MKRKLFIISILALQVIFIIACNQAGSTVSKLNINVGGKEETVELKTSGVKFGNIISTSPGKPQVQTFSHDIYLANYEMDTSSVIAMNKPLTAPEQVKVMISLRGEDGTKDDSPFKPTTYNVKSELFNRVGLATVKRFVDGKEVTYSFEISGNPQSTKADGEVKLTSVTADSISGEIDITEKDRFLKGSFTAKLPKK